MVGSQFNGAIHHFFRRQIADGSLSIPLLDGAKAGDALRSGIRNDVAIIQLLNETGKAIHAMRIDAGFCGTGKHLCTGVSRFRRNAARQQHPIERLF